MINGLLSSKSWLHAKQSSHQHPLTSSLPRMFVNTSKWPPSYFTGNLAAGFASSLGSNHSVYIHTTVQGRLGFYWILTQQAWEPVWFYDQNFIIYDYVCISTRLEVPKQIFLFALLVFWLYLSLTFCSSRCDIPHTFLLIQFFISASCSLYVLKIMTVISHCNYLTKFMIYLGSYMYTVKMVIYVENNECICNSQTQDVLIS